MKERGKMISRVVNVKNNLTDYPAASAQFVQKACEFESHIMIETGNCKFNGKSLMGMLSLNFHEGMEIHIISDGRDEELAAETLGNLIDRIPA